MEMSRVKIIGLICIIALLGLNSCKVMYPNRMFKKGNYEYFNVGQQVIDQYTIQKGDLLTLRIFSRDGFDLVDVLPNETGGGASGMGQRQGNQIVQYLVEYDGFVELPLFGRVYVEGMTENELEDYIEERCSAIFKDPYAILQVTNRRAFVFKGSVASVVSLNQGPTNILEVLAKSGGLGQNLKAYNIKILRGDLKNPEIINVDLSTLEGVQNTNLIVQTNDVIYIEERLRVLNGVLREAAPVVSLISTTTTLVVLIKRL